MVNIESQRDHGEIRSDRLIIIETNANLKNLKEELLGIDRSGKGRIDKIEDTMAAHGLMDELHFKKIDDQLAYWRGALALLTILIMVFGVFLFTHLLWSNK